MNCRIPMVSTKRSKSHYVNCHSNENHHLRLLFAAAIAANFGSASSGSNNDSGVGLFMDNPTMSPTLPPGETFAPSKFRRSRKPKSVRPASNFPTRKPKKSRRPRTGRPSKQPTMMPNTAPTTSKI